MGRNGNSCDRLCCKGGKERSKDFTPGNSGEKCGEINRKEKDRSIASGKRGKTDIEKKEKK